MHRSLRLIVVSCSCFFTSTAYLYLYSSRNCSFPYFSFISQWDQKQITSSINHALMDSFMTFVGLSKFLWFNLVGLNIGDLICHLYNQLTYKSVMIDLAYTIFFFLMIFQVVVFLLLSLPHPPSVQSKLPLLLMKSKIRSNLLWIHLIICVIGVVFFLDLMQTENFYVNEKELLRTSALGTTGTQLRVGFLSYQIQKVKRNQYITLMTVYSTLVLNLFIRMMWLVQKRKDETIVLQPITPKQTSSPTKSPTRQSSTVKA